MTVPQRQNWLQYAIAPRPIALASTINTMGQVNLSPFSFFNLFSSEPPIVIFSPSRRVRDNTIKHTLQNVEEVAEVVINICDFDIVQQVSLSSHEYASGVNEFEKAGFTMEKATMVAPPMVKEAKIKLECEVLEIKALGKKGGAGNLVICEVLCIHVDDNILNAERSMIDPHKIQQVARLGGDWYCLVDEQNLFKINKTPVQPGMGIDALPAYIRENPSFSGNELGKLAAVPAIPSIDHNDSYNMMDESQLINYAKVLLKEQKVQEAWRVLLHSVKNK
ncbi:flavin reductase like domain protein [mine drainage metagenome]|uniref:Flavin reductase like domain protein n=1 Tax=mine drainage metagenome TaxID=410659 RepID=A0A1J5T0L5_9ZZZZ